MTKICALIPCYNVEKYCKDVIVNTLPYSNWVVVIDDGSSDGTQHIVRDLIKQHPDQIHIVVLPQNQGKGAALMSGLQYAIANLPFDILVTLDADRQHLPADMIPLVAAIQEGSDMAIGCRKFEQMPLRSRVANTLMSILLHQCFPYAPQDTQSGFRACTRDFAIAITQHVTGQRYEMEFSCLLYALQKGYKIATCPIHTIYLDRNRSSHFQIFEDSKRILHTLYLFWKRGRL